MPKPIVQVILTPDQIDRLAESELSDATCVVFDVLRATSTMATALANGAAEIHPVRTIPEALDLKRRLGEGVLLGGERHGDRIEGFDLGNSPLEYVNLSPGVKVVTTTTNGTIALRACDGAAKTFVAALVNLQAVADRLTEETPERLVIVCGGTQRALALEDVLGAGALIAQLPDWPLDDASQLALAYYQAVKGRLGEVLGNSENGRALLAKRRKADVEWCAQMSIIELAPVLVDGVVRVLG